MDSKCPFLTSQSRNFAVARRRSITIRASLFLRSLWLTEAAGAVRGPSAMTNRCAAPTLANSTVQLSLTVTLPLAVGTFAHTRRWAADVDKTLLVLKGQVPVRDGRVCYAGASVEIEGAQALEAVTFGARAKAVSADGLREEAVLSLTCTHLVLLLCEHAPVGSHRASGRPLERSRTNPVSAQ